MKKCDIKDDFNFLNGFEGLYSHDVYLVSIGTDYVHYFVFYDDKLIFEGKDFRPSPMYCHDSIEPLVSLLSFLTMNKDDVDSDFFDNWTPIQISYRDYAKNDELKMLLNDFESFDESDKNDVDYEIMKESVEFLKDKLVLN